MSMTIGGHYQDSVFGVTGTVIANVTDPEYGDVNQLQLDPASIGVVDDNRWYPDARLISIP
jgi:hypothetical protein